MAAKVLTFSVIKEKKWYFLWYSRQIVLPLHPQLVREWGVSPQLSRSCKQLLTVRTRKSLILLGRRSPTGLQSQNTCLLHQECTAVCLWG